MSGEDGLALVDAEPFDVIISDIGMPGMDGYNFIRQVRRRAATAHIPAIALTGFGRSKDVELAREAGFSAHVSKPAWVEELLQMIASLAGR